MVDVEGSETNIKRGGMHVSSDLLWYIGMKDGCSLLQPEWRQCHYDSLVFDFRRSKVARIIVGI